MATEKPNRIPHFENAMRVRAVLPSQQEDDNTPPNKGGPIVLYDTSYNSLDSMEQYTQLINRSPLLRHKQVLRIYEEPLQNSPVRLKHDPKFFTGMEEKDEQQLREIIDLSESGSALLTQCNQRLVMAVAKYYSNKSSSMTMLDLIQEGNLGLLKGIHRFEPERGFKLSTYVIWWIRQGISRSILDKNNLIRIPIHRLEQVSRIKKVKEQQEKDAYTESTPEELLHALRVAGIPDEHVVHGLEIMHNNLSVASLDQNLLTDADESLHAIIADSTVVDEEALTNIHYKHVRDLVDKKLGNNPKLRAIIMARCFISPPLTLNEIGKQLGLTRERVRQIEARGLDILRKDEELQRAYKDFLQGQIK